MSVMKISVSDKLTHYLKKDGSDEPSFLHGIIPILRLTVKRRKALLHHFFC